MSFNKTAHTLKKIAITLLIFSFLTSCQSENNKVSIDFEEEELELIEVAVETDVVKFQTLEKERIQNGKIKASKKIIIKSEASGVINKLNIHSGKKIKRGDLIFQADTMELSFKKRKFEIDLDEAIIRKKDKIISSRTMIESTKSDEGVQKTIDIISGFTKVQAQLEEVNYQIIKQKSIAPESGYIADVKIEEHEFVSKGQEICTLISDKNFLIEFNLIENLVNKLKVGQKIEARPLLRNSNTNKIKAKIARINPIVNENGLVKIYAEITSSNMKLIDGMNIQLTLFESIENQMIVPKSAVVQRSDRKVVFTLDSTTMLAKWNYVEIADESENFYSISSGLNSNDKIIISNNLFLENNSKVTQK